MDATTVAVEITEEERFNAQLIALAQPIPSTAIPNDKYVAQELAWTEAQEIIATDPAVKAFFARYYLTLGHKFLGRALLGQSFERCAGGN